MAKALFFSLPASGHVNPSLPLVKELTRRGEQIVYFSSRPFAQIIQAAGAEYRPYRNEFLSDLGQIPEKLHELSWLLMRTCSELLETELESLKRERPDYVITDSVAPWGQWVGELLRVPVVTSTPTFAINRHVLAYGVKHGVRPKSAGVFFSKLRHIAKALRLRREMRRRYGARGPAWMETVAGRSNLNIVYTSRYFQPCAGTFDERYQFVGPLMAARSDSNEFPWSELRDRKAVYVSLGTLFNADGAFYRRCFDAFGGEDFPVILSAGANVGLARLGTAPPNFVVRAHVPQLEVLQRTAAFVTHGGMNSVNEGLYNGVPLLVIPQMSEQEMVGRRVEELGAGIFLANEEVTAQRMRESVRRLLSDSGFTKQAMAVSESFRTTGGVARAADAIIKYQGSCSTSRSSV